MKMFNQASFDIFNIDGLENRMNAIRKDIQPIFLELWQNLLPDINMDTNLDLYIHIAQHLRRTTNAPENTWSAISTSKRGYKNQPHFQIGIWHEYVFVYLSMIDQPKNEIFLAQTLMNNLSMLNKLPNDFVYSTDHTKPDYYKLNDNLEHNLVRFKNIKKAEFEVGRVFKSDNLIWQSKDEVYFLIKDTINELLPIYNLLIKV